jgi:serine protease Do
MATTTAPGVFTALGRATVTDELEALSAIVRRSTVQIRAGDRGVGSGVIWQPDGLIITNAHVARARHAHVRFSDGETVEARLVARDAERDLAALKVEGHGLPAATIGDPEQTRSGELVVALGNPWGVAGALALGVLHAAGDVRPSTSGRYVLADIRLAPGNSGGPLADARGRVIGINTMIVNGLGVAISTREVAAFLRDASGVSSRGGERAA